ncbi:MAG TPA: dienelactone hydrolase family protein [Anaerolineales bacterium]|jgi:carboxymethylenebutenolidase
MSLKKSDIQLKVKDRSAKAYLAAPEKGGPGVLLLHAWWGLKPFFKQVSDQLAEQGFTVLAPDYYQGRVAGTIDEAKAMLGDRDAGLMNDTVKAATDYLKLQNPGKPIGTLGFSMGAAYGLEVAANEPHVAAAVMFYGVGEADYSQVKAIILGHFSDADEWEPLDGVRAMEADMKGAGVDVTLYVYPKVSHWFVEQDRPEYDPAAADLAWKRTFEFLKKNLT